MSDRLYTLEGDQLVRDGTVAHAERSTIFAHYRCFMPENQHPDRVNLKWMVNDDCPIIKGTCILCGQPFRIKGRVDPEEAFQEHYL